jgi:hypothetical protein
VSSEHREESSRKVKVMGEKRRGIAHVPAIGGPPGPTHGAWRVAGDFCSLLTPQVMMAKSK